MMKLLDEHDILFNKKYLIKLKSNESLIGYLALTDILNNMPTERQPNVDYKINIQIGNFNQEGTITDIFNIYLLNEDEEKKWKLMTVI